VSVAAAGTSTSAGMLNSRKRTSLNQSYS
jgi:hypothetical protein